MPPALLPTLLLSLLLLLLSLLVLLLLLFLVLLLLPLPLSLKVVLLLLLLGRLRVSLTPEKLFVRSLIEAQRGREGGRVHVTQ